jgi:hypothetical protein
MGGRTAGLERGVFFAVAGSGAGLPCTARACRSRYRSATRVLPNRAESEA